MSDQNSPVFPGAGRVAGKMEDIIFNMKKELPFIIEYHKQMAIVTKAKYDAFIQNGFTVEQALELCKAGMK